MIGFTESNVYKAWQDLFININDKDTFLEVLAEFYNRTECIIDKNKIQDDLLKELRELYIMLNEKGIDENIVREKIDFFLENNPKIQNIKTKIDQIAKEIEFKYNELENSKSDIKTELLDTAISDARFFKLTNNTSYPILQGGCLSDDGKY